MELLKKKIKQDWLFLLLTGLFALAQAWLFYMQVMHDEKYFSDIWSYIMVMLNRGDIVITYRFLIILLKAAIHFFGYGYGASMVQTGLWILSVLAVKYLWDWVEFPNRLTGDDAGLNRLIGLGALTCCLVGSIWLPNCVGEVYLSTGAANTYHNATSLAAKWINLIVFYASAQMLGNPSRRVSGKMLALFAAGLMLMAYCKPIFPLPFFPAIALIGLYHFIRGGKNERINLVRLALSYVPCCIMLLMQSAQTFGSETPGGNSIILVPGTVYKAYCTNVPLATVFATAFPAFILVTHFRQVLSTCRGQLAWLGFVIGWLEAFFLAEDGNRMYHFNFGWGRSLGLLFLFAVSIPVLIRDWREGKRGAVFWTEAMLLAVHLAFGLGYLGYILVTGRYS